MGTTGGHVSGTHHTTEGIIRIGQTRKKLKRREAKVGVLNTTFPKHDTVQVTDTMLAVFRVSCRQT